MNTETVTQHLAHLTEEQLGSLLAGETPDHSAQQHLAVCKNCRFEADSLRDGVDAFNHLSLDWAVNQAPRHVPVPSRLALRLGGKPAWGLGFAALTAGFVVAVGMGMPHHGPRPAAASYTPTGSPNGDELAEDNRLMRSISQELNYRVQPAVPASELQTAAPRNPAATEMVEN